MIYSESTHNDISVQIEKGEVTAVTLPDFLAAFDTIITLHQHTRLVWDMGARSKWFLLILKKIQT